MFKDRLADCGGAAGRRGCGTPIGQIAMKIHAAATMRECAALVWQTIEGSLRRNSTGGGPKVALAATASMLRNDSHDHAAKICALTDGTNVKLNNSASGMTATPAVQITCLQS